jgi:hypothetical protein
MNRILEAICHNGNLMLEEKLPESMEGRKIKIILVEDDNLETRKAKFLALLDKHSFNLPENYQFNRDEIYGK